MKKQFGRYKIIDKIGQGGMGCVYKAYDPKLCRTIALKTIRSDQIGPQAIERFMREARATAKLKHPHIISAYDMGEEDNQAFFAMDFIEGKSLKDLVKKKLSMRQIAEIMIKVGEAIDYAHSEGIIHRDLKPSNIMLDQNKMPKVMDFGLAKMATIDKKLSKTGMILGTLQYMPPEQAQGIHKAVDERSDVYALGVILYELLTGYPPFVGSSSAAILFRILRENPIPPRMKNKRIPQDIESICLKALEKKSEHRYQSAVDFVNDLHSFLGGGEILAKPWGLKRRLVAKIKQNRYLLVTVIVVLGVVAFSYFFINRNNQKRAKMHFANYIQYFETDKKQAWKELKMACSIAPDCRYLMHKALLLYRGINGKKDIQKAQSIANECKSAIFKCQDNIAYYTIGDMYRYGLGVEADIEKSIKYYEKARKDKRSIINLAEIYLKKDKQKAQQLYKELAEKGHKRALTVLGNIHYGEKNYHEALEWYDKAGKSGDKNAYYLMGYIYYRLLKKKDYNKAIKYFMKAVPLPGAMANIALMYEQGHGTPQNVQLAEEWYMKAINQEYIFAMISLANMYWRNTGVPAHTTAGMENTDKAIKWLKKVKNHDKATKANKIVAMINLGRIYSENYSHASFHNYDLAYDLFEQTIKMGNLQAANYIANMYIKGKRQGNGIYKAIKWLEQASLKGKTANMRNSATHRLGLLYKNFNQMRNYHKSLYWLKKSYEAGQREAAIEIFRIYLIQSDRNKAIGWLERVIEEHNHEGAMYLLGRYYLSGEVVRQDIVKAEELLLKAATAETEHGGAMFLLGRVYLYGQGGKLNIRKGINWLEKSARIGVPAAQDLLQNLEANPRLYIEQWNKLLKKK